MKHGGHGGVRSEIAMSSIFPKKWSWTKGVSVRVLIVVCVGGRWKHKYCNIISFSVSKNVDKVLDV